MKDNSFILHKKITTMDNNGILDILERLLKKAKDHPYHRFKKSELNEFERGCLAARDNMALAIDDEIKQLKLK